MTIEQALQILDAAAARALLTREDHRNVQIAVETLRTRLREIEDEVRELHVKLEKLSGEEK